ncbi:MAG: tRNA-(ms[2]io[6]A)-hydroxylase [Gammaproteobacteria bacterium]|nr:tRNA-(ms[2]io[6]A)-hydroxylase [Gammaproteobacteria bacterium]
MSLPSVDEFLACRTPDAWLACASRERATLLIDHANCEKKAAGNALSLLYRYTDQPDLLAVLSPLAREELLHFEQVVSLMTRIGVAYTHVTPSRYVANLKGLIRNHEPVRLLDTMLVSAVVEARSCERFARLAEVFDDEVGRYYARLVAAERRHFHDYLELAHRYDDGSLKAQLEGILRRDSELIESEDSQFRFHSGVPVLNRGVQSKALERHALLIEPQ